ncbi:chromate transporter [Ferviditalea candida]|uniref:Chromate transporter n=1 Tax=Ferviditalea candida TaxID=3108399 RepID=A0ABU5ZHD3_9BACL|nr:chromate transporter [Paenibacillaceae bacterium T2]
MMWLQIFWAFFITNLLGYGGGPSTIPLIQTEVVDHYHWLTLQEFGDVLALGNALPGPIATKMAGFIGYKMAGVTGAIIALLATILPSAAAMVLLYKFVNAFKESNTLKSLTRGVQPVIAVMLGILAYQFFAHSWEHIGFLQTAVIAIVSFWIMQRTKVHPALAVAGALTYGAVFLS